MVDQLSPKQLKLLRKQSLFNERSSWIMQWQDISRYQQPQMGRFLMSDRNKGGSRYNNIYDNTALFASRTLAAGMMSGMTSPARPWFRLTLTDTDLREFGPVKTWLHRTGVLLREVFARSNTYRALHAGYQELGLFGTWADAVLPDFQNVMHHYPMTIGEYAIGTDHRGAANTLAREYEMTVGAIAAQWGTSTMSATVKNAFDRNQLDQWVPIIHVVEPNKNRDPRKRDNHNMAYSSCYFEAGQTGDGFLSESGFKRFNVLAPRWMVTGQDIYGTSPGMEALGDVKQLQHQQLRKSQGIDYQTNPPIQVPTAYKDAAKNRLPGGVMYVDTNAPTGGVRTAYEVPLRLDYLLADIQDVRERIRSAYYADLFLMLANMPDNGKMTATEVAERHEEKLLMLGPVLERLHNELLSPLIDMTFDYCAEAGILPPTPPELGGIDLNIEFVSTLAQAQRAVAAQGMDRLLGTITSLVQVFPGAPDKIDIDQAIDDFGEAYGVNPEIIRSDDQVAELREANAQKQQLAQQAGAAQPMADAVKTVSEIDADNLQNVMSNFSGYTQ